MPIPSSRRRPSARALARENAELREALRRIGILEAALFITPATDELEEHPGLCAKFEALRIDHEAKLANLAVVLDEQARKVESRNSLIAAIQELTPGIDRLKQTQQLHEGKLFGLNELLDLLRVDTDGRITHLYGRIEHLNRRIDAILFQDDVERRLTFFGRLRWLLFGTLPSDAAGPVC